MKLGSRVWIAVQRDKERLGTVNYVYGDGNVKVLVDGTGAEVVETPDKVRLASPEHINEFDKAVKFDGDKPRVELVSPSAIEEIAKAYTFGAKKYTDNNWTKGFKWTRLIGSALRHILAWQGGEDKDPESGLSHLAHAGACITMLITHEVKNLGEDDRCKL
jgi:hypothetical protein